MNLNGDLRPVGRRDPKHLAVDCAVFRPQPGFGRPRFKRGRQAVALTRTQQKRGKESLEKRLLEPIVETIREVVLLVRVTQRHVPALGHGVIQRRANRRQFRVVVGRRGRTRLREQGGTPRREGRRLSRVRPWPERCAGMKKNGAGTCRAGPVMTREVVSRTDSSAARTRCSPCMDRGDYQR